MPNGMIPKSVIRAIDVKKIIGEVFNDEKRKCFVNNINCFFDRHSA